MFLIMLLPVVSAEILISQPNSIYNMGDTLSVQITLQPKASSNDFASISIVCRESEIEVFKNPMTVAAQETRNFDVSVPLTQSIIGLNSGDCLIRAKYGSETLDSPSFKITNSIDLQVNLNAVQYSPSEIITLNGKAIKENGIPVEGFVKIIAGSASTSLTFPVSNGILYANLSLPRDSAPGELSVLIEVYEKDSNGQITNFGDISKKVKIKQVVKSLSLSLDALEVTPGKPINYKISALDQVNGEVLKDSTFVISMPDGSQYLSKIARTGNTEYMLFPLNSEVGVWTITASLDGITESKTFSMPEIQRADFKFVNDTLVIHNIGNVPYVKSIEVLIGGNSIVKQVSLGLNGSKMFKLLAPSANYQVKVSDGDTKAEVSSILLTGRAIDLGEVKSFTGSIVPAMIIIFAIIVFYIYLKVRKHRQNSYGYSGEYKPRMPLVKATVSQDASVEDGNRETGAIIALRLPSSGNLGSAFQDMFSSLKVKATSKKAHAEARGNFMLFLMTSRLSGEDYEIEAVKLAREIQKTIKSAVSSGNMQVPSSIGITKGEVITSGSLGRLFSFTALGNAVSKAQKLAMQANGEILVSDAVKHKVGTQARMSRFPGTEAWKVDNVVNRDEYSGFVSGFIKRHGHGHGNK